MTGERRRFNTSEKVALYLAAGGRCECAGECGRDHGGRCGDELEPGWHADHRQSYARGGATDVINGQALCPPCNLLKGNDGYMSYHEWQNEALRKFHTSQDDFLCVACPGAGKTRFALAAAQQLMDRDTIRRLVVVAPTSHLREQWAAVAARQFGIQLDPDFKHGAGAVARDFDGVVVTYSAVGSQPLLYRTLTAKQQTLVIADEIHHASEGKTWGRALRQAFDPAARRLLLSGTPFRTDGGAIPFVRPGGDDFAEAGYVYTYGEALTDGIVRPIAFPAMDGDARWRSAGEVTTVRLSQASDEDLARALATALDPDGEWIRSVLQQADAELSQHREVMPDAGGLVIAADVFTARRYAALLERISGQPATVATSDIPDASDRITEFTRGRSRWLVAVQMVSEGVDVPRLTVGVYASDYRTELAFKQITGRFVRLRSPDDETCATLFVPSVEPILTYATEIERIVPTAIREAEERARRDAKTGQQKLTLDLVEPPAWEPVSSSEAVHSATIHGGESFPDDELRRAEELTGLASLSAKLSPAEAAKLIRLAGGGRVVGTAQMEVQPAAAPLADQKKPLRKLINHKVSQLARAQDRPHSHFHTDLNRLCGDSVPTATVETLNQRLTVLDQWLAES